MKSGDCIRELKIHGLLRDAMERNGERKYVLSDEAVDLIREAFRSVRKDYPHGTREGVEIRALILVVCSKMGMVTENGLFDYVSVLKSVAEDYFGE